MWLNDLDDIATYLRIVPGPYCHAVDGVSFRHLGKMMRRVMMMISDWIRFGSHIRLAVDEISQGAGQEESDRQTGAG